MSSTPTSTVTDITQNAERVLATTRKNWTMPDIDDSTMESLGMSALDAEKLRNGGLTNTEYEAAVRATSSSTPSR